MSVDKVLEDEKGPKGYTSQEKENKVKDNSLCSVETKAAFEFLYTLNSKIACHATSMAQVAYAEGYENIGDYWARLRAKSFKEALELLKCATLARVDMEMERPEESEESAIMCSCGTAASFETSIKMIKEDMEEVSDLIKQVYITPVSITINLTFLQELSKELNKYSKLATLGFPGALPMLNNTI